MSMLHSHLRHGHAHACNRDDLSETWWFVRLLELVLGVKQLLNKNNMHIVVRKQLVHTCMHMRSHACRFESDTIGCKW